MDFCKGMVVRSRAGRDAGRWFVILELDAEYAYLADGGLRRLEKPKRKKRRHLARTNTVLQPEQFNEDHKLKEALAAFAQPDAPLRGGQELV